MRCPNCSTELPDSAKFCLECGRDLRGRSEFASPAAYTPKHLADRILTSRAALEGERKQVTVLFCDIANSTPLAERVGPERMHALLNGFFELAMSEVHRYEGTINQFLGDGFMALFGAPLAHEDDARRAVLAAVQIRRALKDRASYAGLGGAELTVRMGLNTGPVVVGSIGDNLRMDYTAVGDTTNVAARLQHGAEPGDILISASTARLVRSEVRLQPAGALALKGKADPVTTYKVLGVAPAQSAFEHAAERAYGRFVGREAELRRLAELLGEAQTGGGALVHIVGEAGAGKSRLLYEFRRTLGSTEVTTLEARCRSYGAAIPFLPLLDLVRNQCGIDERDPPETVTSRVRITLADLGLDPDERAPLLLNLLGVKEGTAAVEDIPQDVVRARTVQTLSEMLVAAGRRRPLLVIIEDLHWIDAASEDYLRSLVDELEEAPILLIGTHRPDWAPSWTVTPECVTTVTLPPLNEEESFSLVADVMARTQLPESLVRTILDRADGNPLFLEELARALAEEGALAPGLNVPDSLRAVLSARIDRLPDAVKRMLQTAAVLGREFPVELLEATWDGPGSLAAHLAELMRLDFVHEVSGGDEAFYAFNHALTQEVAYDSLLSAPREALHEAAARAIESECAEQMARGWERLAYHWTRTPRADKAVEALRRVATRAMATYAAAEAVAALDEAEAHAARLGEAGERVALEVALERAQARFLLGQLPEVIADLEARATAVERLNDPSLTGEYHFRLASARGLAGDTHRAMAHAERALAEAERTGDEATAGKAHYILTRESFWTGTFQRGIEHGRRAVTLLERSGERWWLAMTHWMRGLNYVQLGRFDDALDSAAVMSAIADRLGDPRLASYAAWTGGWARATRGDWTTGVEAGRRALALAPDEMALALAETFLGISLVENAQGDAAMPYLEKAAAAYERRHMRQIEGLLTIYQAEAYRLRGDTQQAAALVARGVETVRELSFAPAVGFARMVQAALARERGDLDGAARLLGEALALAEERDARHNAGRAHLALAEVAAARDDGPAVARHAAEAHRRFVAGGAPVWASRAEDVARAAGVVL